MKGKLIFAIWASLLITLPFALGVASNESDLLDQTEQIDKLMQSIDVLERRVLTLEKRLDMQLKILNSHSKRIQLNCVAISGTRKMPSFDF